MKLVTTLLAVCLFSTFSFSQHLLKDIGAGNGNTEVIAFESTENNVSTDSLAFIYQKEENGSLFFAVLPASLDTVYNYFSVNPFLYGRIVDVHYFKQHIFVLCHVNDQRRIYRFDMSGTPTLIDGTNQYWYNTIQQRFIENINYLMMYESIESNSYLISFNELTNYVNLLYSLSNTGFQTPTLIDNILYFGASHPSYGQELYRTDGAPGSTVLVKDITPGTLGSGPTNFYKGNDGVIRFFARDDNIASGYKLFKTDGTESGTQLIFNSITDFSNLWPFSPVSLNEYTFISDFSGRYYSHNENTNVLTDLFNKVIDRKNHIYFNGKVLILLSEPTTGNNHKYELWETDGTPSGTNLVKEIIAEMGWSSVAKMWANSNGIFIELVTAESPTHQGKVHYFFSDGTLAGTQELSINSMRVLSGTRNKAVGIIDNHLVLNDHYTSKGFEWLKTEGLSPVQLISDNSIAPFSSAPSSFFLNGDKVSFIASDNFYGKELWQTDGTTAGTILKHNWVNYNSNFTNGNIPYSSIIDFLAPVPGGYYFVHPTEQKLYKYNNVSESSTEVLSNVYTFACCGPNAAYTHSMSSFGNNLLFSNSDGTGFEPWFSDGTPSGTYMLTDANAGGSSYPILFTQVTSNLAYFLTEYPKAFWKTDGTPSGTQIVSYLSSSIYFNSQQKPQVRNGKAYFTGHNSSTWQYETWVVDVNSAQKLSGEALPIPTNAPPVQIGTSFFYKGTNSNSNTIFELTDTDQIQTYYSLPSFSSDLTTIDAAIYFTMADAGEMWLHKLTSGSMTKVRKLVSESIYCPIYPAGNDKFIISYALNSGLGKRFFLISDGTEEGTHEIFSIDGTTSIGETFYHQNKFYFNFTTETSGSELWVIDLSCPGHITLNEVPVEDGRFDSATSISLDQPLLPKIELNAGNKIELNPGTLIPGEKPFKAEIRDCAF
ncbi:hypothetical protein [Jiulongibacter sediminis]|uniref:hypothetical protein n=1 Tax=Jiulongibacter sediminis TaxID=1605367 RepID=UPI0026E9FCCF|nr:hypothetical protein [Jiulongibacter sediminis]